MTQLLTVLRSLGIGRQYQGFRAVVIAITLAVRNENCLFCVKRHIYVNVAAFMHSDWRTVERNIRTVVQRAWCINPEYLEEIAGYPMRQAPTVTEFIEIVSGYILRAGTEEDRKRLFEEIENRA